MEIKKLNSILFLLLSLHVASLGQNLNVEIFDINKGLSHNTVYDLVEDHYGYIWIGTQNGLNRFDGYNTTLIAEKQQDELSKNFKGKCITAVFLDSKNNLWTGTRMGHVNVKNSDNYSFSNFKHEYFNYKSVGHEIARFYEDSKSNIWIATVGAGLFKLAQEKDTIYHFTQETSGLSSNDVFDILETNGRILVACGGGNLNILQENGEFSQTHEMKANSPNLSGYRKRLIEANGFIWLGTQGTGLYRIDKQSFEFINFNWEAEKYGFDANVVKDLIKANDSIIYIATDGQGLYKLNTIKNTFTQVRQNEYARTAINSKALNCLAFDKHQNLWIGSYNGGVNIIKNRPKIFSLKRIEGSFPASTSVLSIAEYDAEQLLIGTDGEGLFLYNKNKGSFKALNYCENSVISPTIIKSILKLDNGNFLIGCFSEGLFLYESKSRCFRSINTFLNIWSIKKGPNGHYWLGCLGQGVVELDSIFNQVENNINPISNSGNVMDLEFDSSGNLWLGTGNEGLYIYNFKKNELICLNDHFEQLGKEIRSIKRIGNNNMLIGTEGSGFSLFKDSRLSKTWDLEKGLLTNDAIGFAANSQQQVWLASFKGITVIDLSSNELKNFSLNGVENGNQLNQNALFLTKNNTLYAGGIYGLTRMSINDLNAKIDTSSTYISQIEVQGKSIQSLLKTQKSTETITELNLEYNQNSLRFNLFANSPLESTNRLIIYELKGIDNKQKTLRPGENNVEYINIPPGNYTFQFGHDEKYSALSIVVNSPFWEKTWFRFLIGLLLLGLVGLAFWIMLSKQNEKHKQELLAYKNKELEEELEAKNSRLMYSAVQNASKNELLNELKAQLLVVKSQTENEGLKKVLRMLNMELKNENYWNTFNTYFNEVDKSFIQEFRNKHGVLTQNDQRLVALIRLNLSTNEIASLLNISVRGVEQSKYRLKKKLGIDKEQNLVLYIQNL